MGNAQDEAQKAFAAASDNQTKQAEFKAKLDDQKAKLVIFKKISTLAKQIVDAVPEHQKAKFQASKPQQGNGKALEQVAKKADAKVAHLRAEKDFLSATEDQLAMAEARFEVTNYEQGWVLAEQGEQDFWLSKDQHQVQLKGARAVLEALKAAKVAEGQKARDDVTAKQQKANLATVTQKVDAFETAKAETDKENAKAWYTKAWDFITRPKTLWNEARKNEGADGQPIDDKIKEGGLGVFATIKHIFWPSSTEGKVAYVAGAATVVGGFKYAEHREDKRKSDSRKKLGLAAAGVAATGVAALGLYKGYEAYQAQQEPDEYSAEAGELQTPEKENSQAVGAGSSTKKSGKTTNTKKSNWMIWAVVIVLGLAAIGGAVYYFLFMNEEGSEEDAIPEGMDQV